MRRNTEEAWCTSAEQSMPLREAVTTASLAKSVDDAFGNEQPIEGSSLEDLMGILVVLLTSPRSRSLLSFKIECGIDEILAVGEEESHELLAPPDK
jgi:hypothetical protein